jgi:hypothetical protein
MERCSPVGPGPTTEACRDETLWFTLYQATATLVSEVGGCYLNPVHLTSLPTWRKNPVGRKRPMRAQE